VCSAAACPRAGVGRRCSRVKMVGRAWRLVCRQTCARDHSGGYASGGPFPATMRRPQRLCTTIAAFCCRRRASWCTPWRKQFEAVGGEDQAPFASEEFLVRCVAIPPHLKYKPPVGSMPSAATVDGGFARTAVRPVPSRPSLTVAQKPRCLFPSGHLSGQTSAKTDVLRRKYSHRRLLGTAKGVLGQNVLADVARCNFRRSHGDCAIHTQVAVPAEATAPLGGYEFLDSHGASRRLARVSMPSFHGCSSMLAIR